MFTGEYNHTIDTKGRLIIPAKIREQLGSNCMITRGLDNCITIYTEQAWNRLAESLESLNSSQSTNRMLRRFFFGSAIELDYDKQGRILIPAPLREHASLQKNAVIVGVGNHVEIWSRERYEGYNEEMEAHIEALTESMEGIIF